MHCCMEGMLMVTVGLSVEWLRVIFFKGGPDLLLLYLIILIKDKTLLDKCCLLFLGQVRDIASLIET